MNNDFVFVDEFVPEHRWDAKYADVGQLPPVGP